MSSKKYPLLRKFVQSENIDIFGALLIFSITIYRGFHKTIYFQGEIQFDIPISNLPSIVMEGAFPLGILSIIGAIFSMLSTRLIGKQNNLGNFIWIVITINSGVIDYLFGNKSAIITYPLTFLISIFATYKWHKGVSIRKIDFLFYLIILFGMLIGYSLVFLGFHLFGEGTIGFFEHSVAIIFGLSLGANFASVFKYEETWVSWMIYNVVQLIKNSIQNNLANMVKYIFYLVNATITFFDWKLNGDNNNSTELD